MILPGLGTLKLVPRAERLVRLNRPDGSFAFYRVPAREALVFRLVKPRRKDPS